MPQRSTEDETMMEHTTISPTPEAALKAYDGVNLIGGARTASAATLSPTVSARTTHRP